LIDRSKDKEISKNRKNGERSMQILQLLELQVQLQTHCLHADVAILERKLAKGSLKDLATLLQRQVQRTLGKQHSPSH